MDYGLELLKVIRLKKRAFINTLAGKMITDPLLYRQCEDEEYRLQMIIGKENKKMLKKSYPNKKFNNECNDNQR